MEFIKSWKFMVIVFGVLCVLALAGVIYGVATHEEPGFVEGAPRWDHMPLALCVRSYPYGAPTQDHIEDASYVVGVINERLGFAAYRMSGDECDAVLTIGVPAEPGWQDPGGSTLLTEGHCDAVTSNVHGELLTLTIQHELGHCLGLAHDDYNQSIMRHTLAETPDRTLPPRISDSDRALLRDTYRRAP